MSEEGRAPCADNPELWFTTHPSAVEAAKTLCRTCPIRLTCLRDALANREAYGVFGGLTEVERARLATGGRDCALEGCATTFTTHLPRRRFCSAAHMQANAQRNYREKRAAS